MKIKVLCRLLTAMTGHKITYISDDLTNMIVGKSGYRLKKDEQITTVFISKGMLTNLNFESFNGEELVGIIASELMGIELDEYEYE